MTTCNSLDDVDEIVPWGGAVDVGGDTEGGMANETATRW
jgi:hypothetical protein